MKINSVVTPALIVINVLVFVLMIAAGVSFFEPTPQQALEWGACSSITVILKGEWWRLITCMFVHFGFLHLLMNMYLLFDMGSRLELILGKFRFAVAYFVTGVFGGLISQAWHIQDNIVGAGASGAVFGIIGVFFALITTNLFNSDIQEAYFKRIGILIVVNLAYGMQPGIDMAAHVGGLISGIVLGYIYYLALIDHRFKKHFRKWTYPVVILIAALASQGILKNLQKTDTIHFYEFVNNIQAMEETQRQYEAEFPSHQQEVLIFIETKIIPLWESVIASIDKVNSLHLSEENQKMREYLVKWLILHNRKYHLIAEEIRDGINHCHAEIKQIDEQLAQLAP